ncbi:MAG TPA: NAD(P)-binding domain-containing protein, partial [Longimicrobiales bacterium]
MRIGFVGLGSMGLPMAVNLARAGHEVRAWNRTAGKARAVEEAGGRAAGSVAEAAADAEVVVTMLSDDAAVSGVVFGEEAAPDGILCALPRGAVHACASTIGVALSRRLAE